MAEALKHAVILGHPRQDSFNAAVAQRYIETVTGFGHTAVLRDLYRMGFDPRLQSDEMPRPAGFAAWPDVAEERSLVGNANVFVFVYPLWFNAPPAIVSGYIQRVFGMGFGYGPVRSGGNRPVLVGRRLLSFSSSGAPAEWLRSEGSWAALRNLFDQHLADVCGMIVLDHRHYGRVLNSTPVSRIDAHLNDVSKTATRLFMPEPS